MSPSLIAGAFLLASVLGALPPLYSRWTHLGLHRLVSIAAGIFLGSIFLHLLPELGQGHEEGGAHAHGTATGEPSILPWLALLAGFLLLFVVERVWLQEREKRQTREAHRLLYSATIVGLSLHAFSFGLGLGAILERLSSDWPLLLSLLIHKAAETFSLAVVMSLAHLSRSRAVLYLALFACIEPAAILLGWEFTSQEGLVRPILTGFACGTFLYVAVCDLLPEVFHDSENAWGKLGWLVLGIGITALSLPSAEGLPGLAWQALERSAALFLRMAPYLLVGFLLAGLLSQLLDPARLARHLSREGLGAVVKASLIGAPLPLCSCSVLPVAQTLRRGGASRAATSAFLVATPETGVDSISVTWALLGPWMSLLRPLGAILSAIVSGSAVALLGGRPPAPAEGEAGEHACCHDAGEECSTSAASSASARPLHRRVLRYAFVELLDDIALPLVVGLLLSGLLEAAVPLDYLARPWLQGLPGMLLVLLAGIPVYVCATASTPIAATMLLKGMSPGAAFVFLLSGPATNLASLAVIARMLGKRGLVVHLVALALVTLALGLAVDRLAPLIDLTPSSTGGGEHELLPHWASLACAALFGLLLALSLIRTRLRAGTESHSEALPHPAP